MISGDVLLTIAIAILTMATGIIIIGYIAKTTRDNEYWGFLIVPICIAIGSLIVGLSFVRAHQYTTKFVDAIEQKYKIEVLDESRTYDWVLFKRGEITCLVDTVKSDPLAQLKLKTLSCQTHEDLDKSIQKALKKR